MISVLHEILKLRQDDNLNLDTDNQNRYRVVLNEANGTKTAYYFSTPIYNLNTRRLVRLLFESQGEVAFLEGSDSTIKIGQEIHMKNRRGSCTIHFHSVLTQIRDRELCLGEDRIFPTLNGIVYMARVRDGSGVSFDLLTEEPFLSVRANNRCFSLMVERFVPFITVSCIGSGKGDALNVSSAAILSYTKKSDQRYMLSAFPETREADWLMLEINLHEPKLIQDTTVETLSPRSNNAFGGVAFIGESARYGEQWLYTKFDFQKLSHLIEKRINTCLLHIPRLNDSSVGLSAFGVAARFCSFGSTWDNKIPAVRGLAEAAVCDGYQTLPVTALLINAKGALLHSDGMVIKPKSKNREFSAIATGDSYYSPQILEINYQDM